jgi:outer membrane protein, heavy metal efflux system
VKTLTLLTLLGAVQPVATEVPAGLPVVELPALVDEARTRNPEIAAARRMADATAARVPSAGTLPDPVLSVGLMNLPTDFRLAEDEMAMASVQLSQMLPAPGTRSAREAIAREAHNFAEQRAAEVERAVVARLKSAYYELYFVERALDVLDRNRGLLVDFAEIARGRFAIGATPQQDVLRAQTEVTRLDEQLAGLRARRSGTIAEINAILDRPAATELSTVYPDVLRAIAFATPPPGAFTAAALEPALAADFPGLAQLETMALAQRPALRAQDHRVQQYREALRHAERARFPDVEVMLGYGRQGGGGMQRLSAMVAVPLPVFAARKQRQAVVESRHELAAVEYERAALIAEVRSEIATRLAEVVIPQAQATITSAAAAYQTGTVEFLSLLDAQAMLFRNEIELGRQLADFGRAFAQLELAVGRDLIEAGES